MTGVRESVAIMPGIVGAVPDEVRPHRTPLAPCTGGDNDLERPPLRIRQASLWYRDPGVGRCRLMSYLADVAQDRSFEESALVLGRDLRAHGYRDLAAALLARTP